MDNIINELSNIYFEKDALKEQLDLLTQKEEELREIIHAKMSEQNIRTKESSDHRLTFSLSRTPVLKIEDEGTVKDFLRHNGLLEQCLILDTPQVLRLAKNHQDMPGIKKMVRESLVVRKSKENEAPAQELPQESMTSFRARVRASREEV